MKRLLSVILLLIMIFPITTQADPAEPSDRYSTYGAVKDIDNIFPGDYFSIDLFMSFDLTAYINIMLWDYHDVMSITKTASIKSKTDEKGILYLVFADGSYYTYHKDDDGIHIWLDINGKSIRMKYAEWFNPYTDFKVTEQ